MDKRELEQSITDLRQSLTLLRERLGIDKQAERLKQLESELSDPDLWQNRARAETISREAGELQSQLDDFSSLTKELTSLANSPTEPVFHDLRRRLKTLELATVFTSSYDRGNAILSIYAGAGGQDAFDWAGLLLDMYLDYAARQSWTTAIVAESLDEVPAKTARRAVKNITVEIKGSYAYGYLKKEAGVHRLVRLSPYSAKGIRHTSFALVEVLPELPELKEATLEIPAEDLKIDLYRSSGPGGQNVNKVETAVRIIHQPTGLSAASQVERSQSANRERALKLLKAKLFHLMREQQVEELVKLKTKVKPEWGNQIRSYVFQPYRLVKDHRTGVATNQVDAILSGQLDEFIQAELLSDPGQNPPLKL